MYLIIINIPKKLHSVDLRNYFSEFIEKEAFNCFHFHHRPQYQLVDLIKCSVPAPPDSVAPESDNKITDVKCSEDSGTAEVTSQIGESNVSKLPDTKAEKQNDGSETNLNTDSQGTTRLNTSSQENTGKGRDSQETTSLKTDSQGNTGKESDSGKPTTLEMSSQGNTGKESDSQNITSLKTNSQGNTGNESEELTAIEMISQGNTGKKNDCQESTSLKTNSQGNIGKESNCQETASLKTNSHGDTGKESDSEERTTLEMSLQENTVKESGSICSEAQVQGDKNARNDSSSSLKEKLKIERKKKVGSKWRRFPGRTVKGKGGIKNSSKGESPKPAFGTDKDETSKGQHSIIEQDDVLFRLMTEEFRGRTCCPLDLKDEHKETFFKKYNHKHWVTKKGDILPQRCYLLRVNFWGPSQGKAATDDYKTQQKLSAISLELDHPQSPVEFRPTSAMPQGNVGTPMHRFQELKRSCQLPQKLIKKLGLESSSGSKEDATGCQKDTQMQGEGDIAFTAAGHLVPSSADFEEERKRRRIEDKEMPPKGPKMELESAQNKAEVDQKRSEPFYEDVILQDRIKEQCFEEALEVVWEKGGSGFAFYTEALLWRAQEGDYDEQTANECDVDLSVYDGEVRIDSEDKDARAGVETRISNKLSGDSRQQSILKRKEKEDKGSSCKAKKGKKRRKNGSPASAPKLPSAIGSFETHTKGIGRRILEAQGWKEGQGLGKGLAGRPYALECNGQHPNQRMGLGSTNLSLPQNLRRKEEKDKGSLREASRGRGEKKIAPPASGPTPPLAIGSFEAHTKGIGRRILEAQGWKEGQGLGAGASGRPYALECEGQHAYERKGLGYHGGKLQGRASTTSATTGKPQPPLADHSNYSISTIFHHAAKNPDPSTPTTQNT